MSLKTRSFRYLLCPSFSLYIALSNLFVVPAQAQSWESTSFDSNPAQLDTGVPVEKPIKESPNEVSLEKEYSERGVDWHSWAEKVAGAVWDPLIADGALVASPTSVKWQITKDNRVHILAVKTPFPGGANALVAGIKKLDGNPILAFPRGSSKTVIDRVAAVNGPAVMHKVIRPPKVYP